MRWGIVISSKNTETVWNAFRLANFSLERGEQVKVFLIGEGVEFEKVSNEQFNCKDQAEKFVRAEGKILACGTCIKIRHQEASPICPISTLEELYKLVNESDKVITF